MAARRWTPEEKRRQSALIKTWQPWLKSTGPITADGKRVSSRNADRGGRRARLRALARAMRDAV